MDDFFIWNSLNASVSEQLKLFKCEGFLFDFFYEERVTFFSSERVNPYMGQDSTHNIFHTLWISGNRGIWGEINPLKDVCSSCTRDRCVVKNVCNKNAFVTTDEVEIFFFFFQMFLLKCLTNTVYWLWKPSVLTVLGILGKGWEYWFISGQRATFDFNGTFAWIVCF